MFLSSYFYFFLPETKLFARQVKVQIEKSFLAMNNIKCWNAELGGK